MSAMVIECPCGVVLRGPDEAAVVESAQQHAKSTHDMEMSDMQAREMAHPA